MSARILHTGPALLETSLLIVLLLVSLAASAGAQTGARPQSAILITNARIFYGKNEKLIAGMSVLVDGNRISKIAPSIPGA